MSQISRTKDPKTGFLIIAPGTPLPGGYRIESLLGAGGFGSVYVAQGPHGRCALKEFRPHPSLPRNALLERVDMETEVIRSFTNHPCLPGYLDRLDVGDTHFLAEELIAGVSLSQILRSGVGAFTLGESIAWLCLLTRTLDHLHRRLLLYQDLKPANILITPDRTPVLVDFGAARHYAGVKANPRLLFGSLGYVAPEILQNPLTQRDYRSDVYSLGCLAYTLFTGRTLSRAQILGECGITLPSRAIRRFRPESETLPAAWLAQIDELLLTALQPDPADRLADLKWFGRRFQGLLLGAGDTENVDAILRIINSDLVGQDRALEALSELPAEGDAAQVAHDPPVLVFAPLSVQSEVVTQPVSLWTKSGKPLRATVECTTAGVECVEDNFRVAEGRLRVRVFPRRVRGLNHWTKGALTLRLHTHQQVRIPIHIFVVATESEYLNGAPLPPLPADFETGPAPCEQLATSWQFAEEGAAKEEPICQNKSDSGLASGIRQELNAARKSEEDEPAMDYENPHRREGQTESTMFVAPMVQAQLVNDATGAVHQVSGNVTTLGRGEANKVIIADRSVSREHCRIERTVSGYTVVDKGSTNGTYVNGHRITRTTLHEGDTLKVGAIELRFVEGG